MKSLKCSELISFKSSHPIVFYISELHLTFALMIVFFFKNMKMIDNKYFFELQMHMIFFFTNFESEGALLNNISCYTF